ncbi:MAG: hypothetical protein ACP5LI_07960 [Hydrogenobaculum sp.]
MEKKTIIVFNGIHNSGKTLLATKFVENDNRFKFFEEMGWLLRKQVTYDTLTYEESFDRKVMQMELERDRELLASRYIPIVETWHFGNLAYVMLRSPTLMNDYINQVNNRLQKFEPIVLLVKATIHTCQVRETDLNFIAKASEYKKFWQGIYRNLLLIYRRFNINYEVIDNNGTIEEALNSVKKAVYTRLAGLLGT